MLGDVKSNGLFRPQPVPQARALSPCLPEISGSATGSSRIDASKCAIERWIAGRNAVLVGAGLSCLPMPAVESHPWLLPAPSGHDLILIRPRQRTINSPNTTQEVDAVMKHKKLGPACTYLLLRSGQVGATETPKVVWPRRYAETSIGTDLVEPRHFSLLGIGPETVLSVTK